MNGGRAEAEGKVWESEERGGNGHRVRLTGGWRKGPLDGGP